MTIPYHINSQTAGWLQGIPLLLLLGFFLLQVHADESVAEASYRHGRQLYAAGSYEAAIEALSTAVKLSPYVSTYHHWLGKSYGRLAQNTRLFKAYRLATRTREEFERAVELDDENIEAIEDLIEFYRQAPAFLGGGQDKADALRRRLETLQQQNKTGGSTMPPSVLSHSEETVPASK